MPRARARYGGHGTQDGTASWTFLPGVSAAILCRSYAGRCAPDSNIMESDPIIFYAAFAIFRQGILMSRIAAASVSTARGRSKLARHASATLREGTGVVNGTTLSSFEAYRGTSALAGNTLTPRPEATMLRMVSSE